MPLYSFRQGSIASSPSSIPGSRPEAPWVADEEDTGIDDLMPSANIVRLHREGLPATIKSVQAQNATI
jgi:hypothetical protein